MTAKIALAGLGKAARTIRLPAISSIKDLHVVGGYDPAPPGAAFPRQTLALMLAAYEFAEKRAPVAMSPAPV